MTQPLKSLLRRLRPSTCLGVTLLSLALSPPALAGDKAAAESLFNAGKELMEEERYAQACEKFAASMDAEPSVGAQLNLALCHEKQGKTATAWTLYRDAAVMAGALDDDRRQRAAEALADELEPKLSKLTVHVTHRPDGLRVTRGDVDVAAFDTALPVDPGRYRVEATAPGYASWSTEITIPPDAAEERLTIPRLERLTDDADDPPRAEALWQPIVGWSAVGLGALGLTVGTIFGAMATSDANDLESSCGSDKTCPDDRLGDLDTAKTRADVATGTLIAGGLIAVGGAVLLLIDPIQIGGEASETALVPTVGPGGAGLTVTGRF